MTFVNQPNFFSDNIKVIKSICLYFICIKYSVGQGMLIISSARYILNYCLPPLQRLFRASILFMYNNTFYDIFLLGKKTPYPLPPVFYTFNVQKYNSAKENFRVF